MQNVPKIVQARLPVPSSVPAEAHPDADLLAGFAEQSLAESERARVMEHLARCGDCRDVVALALPATEAVTMPGSARAARGGRLSWPVLRWSVVAAGILLVTSVGVMQYKQRAQQNAALVSSPVRQEEKIMTASQSQQPSTQTPGAQAAVPSAPEIVKQTPTRKLSRAQSAVAANQPSPSLSAIFPRAQLGHGASSGGRMGGGFVGGSEWGSGQAFNNSGATPRGDAFAFSAPPKELPPAAAARQNPTPQSSTAAPTQKVLVPGAAEMVEVQSETAQITPVQNPTEVPSQNRPSTNLDVVKAKDSVPPQDTSSVVFAPRAVSPNASRRTASALTLRAAPRWTISSAGALQRSFDAGKTWEDVNVVEDVNVRSESLASRALVERSDRNEEKKNQKETAQRPPALLFRAVAAVGSEVWAGGSGAMLYHSVDSGTHWTRARPAAVGAVLTGDVISIQFLDTQNGSVTTSNAERWTTADDGQTWRKQR